MSDWVSQPLAEDHDVSQFGSGSELLDRWLQREGLRAQRAGISRTTVWTHPGERIVVAYHAIAPTQVARSELRSRSLSTGYTRVLGYLVGRLALDQTLHGQGLRTELLLDALERIVEAADRAGARVIVVDAIDEAARHFYRHHGFDDIEDSNRLVMKLTTAAAILG